jgi:hypothetical protein
MPNIGYLQRMSVVYRVDACLRYRPRVVRFLPARVTCALKVHKQYLLYDMVYLDCFELARKPLSSILLNMYNPCAKRFVHITGSQF